MYTLICTLLYVHPHICTPSSVHSHLYTFICTPSYVHPHVHPHMCTLICTPSYVHLHMYTLICTPSYGTPSYVHLHNVHYMILSITNCTLFIHTITMTKSHARSENNTHSLYVLRTSCLNCSPGTIIYHKYS